MPPLLPGCAECPRRSTSHDGRTDRRSLLRACTGGAILAVVPAAGGCYGGSIGQGADLNEGDVLAGDEAGQPREAGGGARETGGAGEAGGAGDAGEPREAGEAGGAREAGGSGRDAESDLDAPGCTSSCSTGPITAELTFDEYPSLAQVGGSVLVQLMGYSDPACGLDVVIVVQRAAGEFLAFSAACTHQCCAVTYQAAASRFYCGCHGSAYDLTGKVVAGPAERPLTALRVCSDACGVTVTG